MKNLTHYFLACIIGALLPVKTVKAQIGNTTVAKWKDNKKGAYSLRFDDSMMSHKDHAIPNLVKRGLVGSFYINPASERYGYGIDSWESLVSRVGIELNPHTMNHTGAADFEEADYEIGEAFNKVWSLNPPDKSKMYPFSRGGGTTWPSGYIEAIQNKYPIADYQGLAVRYSGEDDRNELISFAKKAMKDNAWHMVLTHGTGPNLEWLGFEVGNFEALLDYIASVKDKLWVGNIGEIYKYIVERNSAVVSIIDTGEDAIRLNLSSDTDAELFDYPLTLTTNVPSDWTFCHISQGNLQGIYPVKSGIVNYEAIPNRGEVILKRSSMDSSPPDKVVVRDGTAADIDSSPLTHRFSANWDMAEDPESGISRYWYKIGSTPYGSEVLDWIDNGLERKITTSRTNFSLVRGEKYYITVKSVNGVGLSSESTSDGFTVDTTPDYISFREDFDNGYLSQWSEKRTRYGSEKNQMFISDQAAHKGSYGIQCHLQEDETSQPYIANHNLPEVEDVFTRFHFKLSSNFTIPVDGGSIQLLELRDNNGAFIAGAFLGYRETLGMHVYARARDNTGYTASLPTIQESYPLSFAPVAFDQWIRVDLRTMANDGTGGAELWINGLRVDCITHRFTGGKAARSLYLGAINISNEHTSGEIFFDDISVSDSYLR